MVVRKIKREKRQQSNESGNTENDYASVKQTCTVVDRPIVGRQLRQKSVSHNVQRLAGDFLDRESLHDWPIESPSQ